MSILELSRALDSFMWSYPALIMLFGTGLYLSIRLGFPQIRYIKDIYHVVFKDSGSSEEGISPFASLAVSVGGRVGTGNIVGVATGIAIGGPGAVFWIWITALLGGASAFVESSLAQVYKEKVEGEYRGGPPFYMAKALNWKPAAFAFCVIIFLSVLAFGSVQSNSFVNITTSTFDVNPVVLGGIYSILAGSVIFGGARRIAKAAEKVVPFMTIAYLLAAIVIMIMNFRLIPEVFRSIFASAFGLDAIFGAIVANAIIWGIKRACFSNDAGTGYGALVSGSSECSHPAKQGLTQAFSVYIDTLGVCTATAFMILSTNSFNVANPAGGFLVENIPGAIDAQFPSYALNAAFPGVGGIFLSVAITLFTFTTVIAYSVYVEGCAAYLYKNNTQGKSYKNLLRLFNVALLISIFLGSITEAELVWNLASLSIGIQAVISTSSLILLVKPGIAILKNYREQKKLGLDPVFIPEDCGIEGAELWNEIIPEKYPEQYKKYLEVYPNARKKY